MLDKIALEEHFATEQTLGDSQEYFFADRWEESKRRLLDCRPSALVGQNELIA
jgi:2,3-dihydroxybenzoate decarboxylase